MFHAREVLRAIRGEARHHDPEPLDRHPLDGLVPKKARHCCIRCSADRLVDRMPVQVPDESVSVDHLDPLRISMQNLAITAIPLETYGPKPDGVAFNSGPLTLERLRLVAIAVGDSPALKCLPGGRVDFVGYSRVVAEGDEQPVVDHQLRQLHGAVPCGRGGPQLQLLVPSEHEAIGLGELAAYADHAALLEVGPPDELLWVT
mmetsp:Transcript_37901/g.80538  ORF Transcript_37901/g.80538 Transcript_37901/m.80538 type:complete len:203 (+) Transcript_37901:398-1006(+)